MNEIWCFIICFGSSGVQNVPAVDTFCATYQQIVLTKSEIELMLKLPKELRSRIQANDLEYVCRCKGFKHQVCEEKKQNG